MQNNFFDMLLPCIFKAEGGYNNNPNDRGGKTNYGITQDTFNSWRKMNNKPIGNVKTDISPKEARDIYYNMFWKESGADKLDDPREALVLFDFAVNTNPYFAKNMFKKSNNNYYDMLENRRKHYDKQSALPGQAGFREGWYNRQENLEKFSEKILKDGLWRPSYYNELTPFDDGYDGNLKPVGDIPNKEKKRNKYQYNRNKAIQNGIIKSDVKANFAFPRKLEDMAPWEIEDIIQRRV